ncbi:MAG: hypothetical protein CBD03_00465 [Rhizobiales bacterium TMED143]|nr:peroxidase [Rhodobiaceae bacterium]OUV93100.1 MAG: hypothetical protein CBD03_00465 [Rhizobiales bacterium TMED143]HAK98159.1 peroxidase [Rhodobiaceae bacterium]|tara:strand:- start:825 stop:1373 length:549 start_codon:yes stop_codon:yes gene_type:complete
MSQLFSSLPENPSLRDVLLLFPKASNELMAFIEQVMRTESPLSIGQRELLATFVSSLNSCQFCYGAHLAFSRAFGIEDDEIASLLQDIDSASIEEELKPLFRYVKKLTLEPSKIQRKDAEQVFQAGWSELALFDAVQVCSLFNMMNRLVDGTGVKPETVNTDLDQRELEALREVKYTQYNAT